MAPVVAAQAAPMSPRAEAQQVERRGARYAGSGEDVTLNRTGTQNYAASPAGGAPAGLGSGPILKTAAQQNALQAASWPADPDPDQAAGDPDLPFGGTPAPESARVAASPSAMVAPAPQHHGAAVAKQIAAALQTNGPGQTEIVLDPQELGRGSLSLSSADGSITVAIVADRPETMDLIRRVADAVGKQIEPASSKSLRPAAAAAP